MWRRLGVGIALIGGVACTSATSITTTGSVGQPTSRASNFISFNEIRSSQATDVYQAISRLRPIYFNRARDIRAGNTSTLEVYLNDIRLGGLTTLTGIQTRGIVSIQYLSASEATMRWGHRHKGDVILVMTR